MTPSPESFNRLQNTSPEDLDRFIDWLFSHTLVELRASRGKPAATREAWIRYFQRGLKADVLLDELMTHVPELFRRAQYPEQEASSVLAMVKALNFTDLGIQT
jgi:hypothetical protein